MKDPDWIAAEREDFESWALSQSWRVDRTRPYGVYRDRRTNSGWLAWIARVTRAKK